MTHTTPHIIPRQPSHQRRWLGGIIAMVLCALVGCSTNTTPHTEEDKRLGAIAFNEAAALIETHPQRIAGVHSSHVAKTLEQRLTNPKRKATRMPFSAPQGTMVNVLYSAPEGIEPVVLLVSHFDTKIGIDNFVGANDGASTTGLLIALANETNWPIMCLFTDGEECVTEYSDRDGLHGSWHAAKQGIGGNLPVVVLDMLGDKEYTPAIVSNASDVLNASIRVAAKRAGITLENEGDIIDDHVPFYAYGRRVANIIDFNFGEDNAYWHTEEDTLDKISADSLGKTATLIRYLIEELQRKETIK